ncbi:TlpA disulfide reductase family protein [Novosphingobium sp.]|uniref:TlpA family protein disulfide reductase n=1 Tax=Novosphingobium sp. TaxID=1874826 RepID=UPI0033422683
MRALLFSGLLALAALPLVALPLAAHANPKVGQIAPDARFETVTGQKFDLASLRGQVVIINFWATWCVPCRQELPLLDAYYRKQKDYGLVVLAATTEDSVPEYQLKKLFGIMAITPLRRLKGPYAPLEGVPTNYVIDRAGVVRYAEAGAFSLESLNDVLVPLLREAPSQTGTTTAALIPATIRPGAAFSR